MANQDREAIIRRIKKMMNLSEDSAAAEGEIENALRFASKLMATHRISRDEIEQATEGGPEKAAKREMDQVFAGANGFRTYLWEATLASYVCDLVGSVKCYMSREKRVIRDQHGIAMTHPSTGKTKHQGGVVFYGVAEDCLIARDLFEQLCVTIAAMGRLKHGGAFKGDGGKYCEGFVMGLSYQLGRERAEVRSALPKGMTAQQVLKALPSGSSALDHADAPAVGAAIEIRRAELAVADRNEAANWLKNEKGIKLGTSKGWSGASGSRAASAEGYRDGQRHGTPTVGRTHKLT